MNYIPGIPRGFRAGALALFLAALLCCGTLGAGVSSSSAGEAEPPVEYRDGVYEGSGRAYRDHIVVGLRIEGGIITEINILQNQDDPFVGGPAIETLTEQVLEYNSVDLDAVSGATESSAGFFAAVEDALGQARLEENREELGE
ncbi:MAG: FMN-binding protein [Treponema sp.]|nr:FMN-binding protein [Treponema sp.]